MNNPKGAGPDVPIAYEIGVEQPEDPQAKDAFRIYQKEIDQLKVQLTNEKKWAADLVKQCSELEAQLAAVTAERDELQRDADYISETLMRKGEHSLLESVDNHVREVAEICLRLDATTLRAQESEKQRDAAQKACAEMREALESERATHGHSHFDFTSQHGVGCELCIRQREAAEKTKHALSSSCGTDYVKRSELEPTKNWIREIAVIAANPGDRQSLKRIADMCADELSRLESLLKK